MTRTLPQLPTFFDATPETLLVDTEDIITTTRQVWDRICANISTDDATFDNVIAPIIQDENAKLVRRRIIAFYPSVAKSKAVREAAREATKVLSAADIELYSRADMFKLVNFIEAKSQGGTQDLDSESQHYLTKLKQKFIENGCNIQDPGLRARFALKLKELKSVNSQVSQNFHEETAGVWFTQDELAGVPEALVARFKRGSDQHEGYYWVSTKTPFSTPVLRHATVEETRKRMFYAVKNRLPENVKLFRQLVLLRDETARMLGYAHHLSFTTSQKASQTPEFVYSLIDQLRRKVQPAAAQNVNDLLQLKLADQTKGDASSKNVKMYLWDQSYYADKQASAVQPDPDRVSQYFELYHTFDRILEMFGGLLDTRFDLITEEEQHQIGNGATLTWHEDVLIYAVWDTRKEGTFLGYAYFDFFSRDGKYSHNGHYATTWGFDNPDGSRFYPSSALVMNLSKPTTKNPTLLSMNNLRMLFHELGHLHHSLLTKTKYASLSYVDRDFVEVPSIMFEQFLWHEAPIKQLSRHYSYISSQMRDLWSATHNNETFPPEKLPDEDAAALAESDTRSNVRSGLLQLFFASYDVLVHAPESHEALERMNLTEEFNKLQYSIRGLHGGEACGDGWEWSHGESVFRAISGGYSGGYYAYVIGQAWGLDMFVSCFNADINNKDAARRYRDLVLARGGRQPELQTFKDFVGREPKLDAFFSWLGL